MIWVLRLTSLSTVKLQADEISSIIKERIENFEIDVDINEIGKVVGIAHQ